jgi:hypothetical protein
MTENNEQCVAMLRDVFSGVSAESRFENPTSGAALPSTF